MEMKRVSVIMPCHNDGQYINESINSVITQTYENVELIIIDDGSDDKHTLRILENIHSSITVIHTKHLNPAAARNEGIKRATGKYILPLDADDKIDKTYIEKAVKILEANQDLAAVYCYANYFGLKHGRWKLPDYSLERMLLDNIVFVSALFYKSDWEKVGGFHICMVDGLEDYDFWLSILELGREIYQIKEVLFYYRIKKQSRTTIFQNDCGTVKKAYQCIYENHPQLYSKYKEEYIVILRDSLTDVIFVNETLKKIIECWNILEKIPFVKKVIRKFIVK